MSGNIGPIPPVLFYMLPASTSPTASDYKDAAKAVSLAVGILRRAMPEPTPEDRELINRIHEDYLRLIKQAMVRELPARDSASPLPAALTEHRPAA